MSPRSPRLSIAIVGAGIAGSAAATALSRAGHSVHLFEQSPALLPLGAGLLLQPTGQSALARLNLLNEILPHAHPIHSLHAHIHRPHHPRKTLLHLPFPETSRALGIHRPTLFSALHSAALSAGATLHLNTQPVSTQDRPHHRRALTLSNHTTTQDFDLVIAADGARSRLRASSGLRHLSHTYAHTALWATVPCSFLHHKLLQVTQGTQTLLGILPLGNNRASFFFGLPPSSPHRALNDTTFPAFRDHCLTLAPEAEEIFTGLSSFSHLTHTPFHHTAMPTWHNGKNLVFIGDAAHAMSPHFGQGVNLALLDALALTDAIQHARNLPTALHTYQLNRRPHTRLYATLSLTLTPFFQGNGHLKALARNLALPLMTKIPPVRKRMIQTMTGLRPSLSGF